MLNDGLLSTRQFAKQLIACCSITPEEGGGVRLLRDRLQRSSFKYEISPGPANATTHKINECVEIEDLPRFSAIYTPIFNQLMP